MLFFSIALGTRFSLEGPKSFRVLYRFALHGMYVSVKLTLLTLEMNRTLPCWVP